MDFKNEKKMDRVTSNIMKYLVILINHFGRDFLFYDFVKAAEKQLG